MLDVANLISRGFRRRIHLGRRIFESVCAECWDYWLRNLSIKVINEMRLDLSTERGQEVYDQVMRETLGLE